MHTTMTCPICGYELTGLAAKGTCPECGRYYDLNRPSTFLRQGPAWMRYGKSIFLGLVALGIVIVGLPLSFYAKSHFGGLMLTLIIAFVPAFGAFSYWWAERKERYEE